MSTSPKRFGRFLKSSVSALLQPAEDPRKNDRRPELEQQRLLAHIRNVSIRLTESSDRFQTQRDEVVARIDARDQDARQALRSGQEQFARMALRRQRVSIAELSHIDTQIAGLQREEERLTAYGQQILAQVEAIRAREHLATARHSAAQAQLAVDEALGGISSQFADQGMIEMIEQETEQFEARTEAIAELREAGLLGNFGGQHSNQWRSVPEDELDEEIEERMTRLKSEMVTS